MGRWGPQEPECGGEEQVGLARVPRQGAQVRDENEIRQQLQELTPCTPASGRRLESVRVCAGDEPRNAFDVPNWISASRLLLL